MYVQADRQIGLNLPKHQETNALLSVVENCEEILLDASLGDIIKQFVRELAVGEAGKGRATHSRNGCRSTRS